MSQLGTYAPTLAGPLRLMSASSSEEKGGDRFSAVCPLSVVFGPQSHPHRPANSGFRPCRYSVAVTRQVADLGLCLVVQRTGRSGRLAGIGASCPGAGARPDGRRANRLLSVRAGTGSVCAAVRACAGVAAGAVTGLLSRPGGDARGAGLDRCGIVCRSGGRVRLVLRRGRSCRSGQVRHVARTVSVAVRADRRMEACGHGHIADSVVATSLIL